MPNHLQSFALHIARSVLFGIGGAGIMACHLWLIHR